MKKPNLKVLRKKLEHCLGYEVTMRWAPSRKLFSVVIWGIPKDIDAWSINNFACAWLRERTPNDIVKNVHTRERRRGEKIQLYSELRNVIK